MMDDYIPNPVRSKDLAAALKRWLTATIPPNPLESSAVSLEMLREETGGDPESFRELLELYLEQTSDSLAKLNTLIVQNAPDELALTAHACAGSSISFGAPTLAALFRELEMMSRARDLTGASTKLTAAAAEFERVASYMNTLISHGTQDINGR